MTPGILNKAFQEARKSSYRIAIGCVIFKGSRIMSSGYNQIRSSRISPKHKLFYNSLHAEQDAILKVNDWSKLKGCSILVVRLSKKQELLGMAKPCPMCLELLRYVGIKNIHFSSITGEIIKLG